MTVSRGINVDCEVLCKHAENITKLSWGTNRVVRKSERALSLSWVLRTWKQCHCGTHDCLSGEDRLHGPYKVSEK